MKRNRMYVGACVVTVLVGSLLTVGAAKDDAKTNRPDADSPEIKVLERFVGTWMQETTINAAKWTPTATHANGTMDAEWSLDHHFIRAESLCKDADLQEKTFRDLRMITWDAESQKYKSWYFDSMGFSSQSLGTWDEKENELTFKSDLGHGIHMLNSIRFVDEGTQEWTLKAEDKAGTVFLDMQGTMKRQDVREAKLDQETDSETE